MTWLFDGNVLTALVLEGHVHHTRVKQWMADRSRADNSFATCATTQGNLSPGRDPAKVTRPATSQGPDTSHNPRYSLYGIFGEDPRRRASKELGERLVQEIVGRIEKMVDEALLNGS
jgi:hypothetical protein